MISTTFQSLVLENFNKLTTEFGFSVVRQSNSQVRFENNAICININYDSSRSYELDIELGQCETLYSGKRRMFNFGELLRAVGAKDGEDYRACEAQNSDVLSRCITKLAGLLFEHCKDYLKNDKSKFIAVSKLRDFECDQYALNRELEHIRQEALLAWKKENFKKVVSLFEPVQNHLSASELKKMHYSQKKLKKV